MIKYKLEYMRSFSVCGMETEITRYQNRNIKLCKDLWEKFNHVIYDYGLHQLGDWKKYAFTYRSNGKYYYYCSIPEQLKVPKKLIVRQFPEHIYLVIKHFGSVDTINQTLNEIYKDFIPSHEFIPQTDNFIHFEKYDYRYIKHCSDSIIDIYIPVERESACKIINLYDDTFYN